MHREPWNPTVAQRTAALRLADNTLYGASVKTRSDGVAVVRTVEQQERRRYHISEDGQVTLAEVTRRRSAGVGRALLVGGGIVVVTMVALLIVLQVAQVRTGSELEWAGWLVLPGFVAAGIGQWLLLPESDSGEWWVTIGAPRD